MTILELQTMPGRSETTENPWLRAAAAIGAPVVAIGPPVVAERATDR